MVGGRSPALIRIASRGSTLALWQAHHVQSMLRELHHDVNVEIDVIRTTGDRITDVPLSMIGDKGLFTKEVDDAVLDGRAHLAVHSFKDVPTKIPEGLALAAVLRREDPRDAFLPAPGRDRTLSSLPAGARVGTSSLRRRALLLAARPDITIQDLRGNLDTRLEKLDEGSFDAIILALAGLRRIGRESAAGEVLGPPHWLPAAGQGALALVARADDTVTLQRVQSLDDTPSRAATAAERSFLAALEGGCQIPIGALGEVHGSSLQLGGLVASLDGRTVVRGEVAGPVHDASALGETLALRLIEDGALDVLRAIRHPNPDVPAPQAP